MDAFFALKGGRAVFSQRDGLAGTHGDAGLLFAGDAKLRIAEGDVIGESGHGLDLAADEERVLLRDQQAAVEGNLRPAARREQGIMERASVGHGQLRCIFELQSIGGVGGEGTNLLVRRRGARVQRKFPVGQTSEGHADHAFDDSALESVAGVFCFARAARNPTQTAARFIGGGEIFLCEGFPGAEQFDNRVAELRTGGPCLIDAEVVKEGNVFPMVPAGASLREMIIDPPRVDPDEEGESS